MTKRWPNIPYESWKDSCATLHLWTQIVGKYRFAQTPWINHSWHATFYVTPRGLTTSPIPTGDQTAQFDFDFVDHQLIGTLDDGTKDILPLRPMTVADFYERFLTFIYPPVVERRVIANAPRTYYADNLRTDRFERRRAASPSHWENWSGRWGSNPRPVAWEATALPLSYTREPFFAS